eukprot:scaffold114596_cov21-Tisochrysis_lutea.AAC.3
MSGLDHKVMTCSSMHQAMCVQHNNAWSCASTSTLSCSPPGVQAAILQIERMPADRKNENCGNDRVITHAHSLTSRCAGRDFAASAATAAASAPVLAAACVLAVATGSGSDQRAAWF